MYKEFPGSVVFCFGLLVAKTKNKYTGTPWWCMYDQTILAQKYLYLDEHGNYYMYCPYPRLSDYEKNNE